MNRNKEFIKNTFILFAGKFTTQFMTFLLLPLYTHYLLSADYGLVDLFQTYVSLLVPILTLRIDSAAFRFLVDERKNKDGKEKIISNLFFILLFSLIVTLIFSVIVINCIKIKYSIYIIINLIILMVSSVFLQILRGLGKNKEYSITCIIVGFMTLLFNIILIIVFKINASSILISSSIANVIGILYIVSKSKIFRYIKFKKINKTEMKSILKYSCPMIPNALSWWIVNASDRTIISAFLGSAFNGIYAVSCKFSNILNSVYTIFNMSWQETASLHINDEDKEVFFSDMINKIFHFFCSISILIIAILPFVFNILIGENYYSSYTYIPILLYANLWNILVGLIGAIYVAKKKTKEIANTTIISAILNIIINFLLIQKIGLYAACISTLISYVVICIYRYIDCKKYVRINLDIKNIIIITVVFIISSFIYTINNFVLNLANLVLSLIYTISINRLLLKHVLNKIKNIF